MPIVDLRLNWSAPVKFEDTARFPAAAGIYAVAVSTDLGYNMERIGAAHSLAARPSNYDPTPFILEPRLMVSYCLVPDDFRVAMAELISVNFPRRLHDLDWLEYRIERLGIETYKSLWGQLPLGNFQEGSKREYMNLLQIQDGGHVKMLSVPPATLGNEVIGALKQSKKKAES